MTLIGFDTNLIDFKTAVFSAADSTRLLARLEQELNWKQEELLLYGRRILTPRLTAWYGEPGLSYRYSGRTFTTLPWTDALLEIKAKAESFAHVSFNSVLCNLYRNGHDSMSWHSDDEKELGVNPVIASVNFGQERRFDFRRKTYHADKRSILLTNGSIMVMSGDIQHHWQHQLPKSLKARGLRINLTFREIIA